METRVITDQESLNEILKFLRESNLPYQDIKLSDNLFVSYHDPAGELVGSGGLEFYSNYALLRSVAVHANMRGQSIGKEIVSDLLSRAKSMGCIEVYLLTETARDFFLKLKFSDTARELVPAEIKSSTEFASVCPVSAAVMVYRF